MSKPKVEGSTEKLPKQPTERKFKLRGLEDVPRSIIPVPFYKFVQPNTDKAFLPDGKRADNGNFLMPDIRKEVDELRIVILRAKRSVRMQKNDYGQVEKVVSLQILGINLDRQKPFILGVPVTSFSAFGKIFEELEERGAKNAWDYPVYISAFEEEKPKETPQGVRNVSYWVIEATLEQEELADEDKKIASEMFEDFAGKLDREEDEDDLAELAGKVFN